MKEQLHKLTLVGTMILFQLFFVSTINAQSNYDIYVYNVKSGKSKQIGKIPNAGEYNASWNPNGKKIASDVVGDIAYPYSQSIFITDVETGISTLLKGAEGGNDAAWSPDGKIIAFDTWYYSPQSIFTVPAKGGTSTLLRYNAHHASWNPKGDKIAFDDNNGYIGTRDINTGIETFITNYGDRPAWSPNGKYIAFDGFSWAGGGVWIIKVDANGNPIGSPVQLTTSGYGPIWKVNSKEIVFVDWPNGDPDIYSIPITGSTSTRVCGRIGGFDMGDYDPAYSSCGEYIAWSSYTDTSAALTSASKENAVTKQLSKNNFILSQNYPNPFTAETTIDFNITEPTHVTLTIYNLSRQKVHTLVDADYQVGSYHSKWDGKNKNGQNLPNGIYLYQLKTQNGIEVKKMILMH